MKKINNKPPKWMLQLFSDREESDDSNIEDNGNSNDEDDYYIDEDEGEEEEGGMFRGSDSDSDSDSEDNVPAKKPPPRKIKSAKIQEEDYEMPGLVPTYSKVEQEISGGELKRDDIIKILEIALYWLLQLP